MEVVLMPESRRREAGFSLIEVLVAAAILLVIALGLVPLYVRSIRSNVEGFDYTQVANSAKSRAEEFLQYGFNDARLTVPGGQDSLEVQDFYSVEQDRWVDEADWPPVEDDQVLFTRTATVRQFSITDLATPIPGGAGSEAVHLKEITVTVEGSRTAVLGGGKRIAVRVFKSQ